MMSSTLKLFCVISTCIFVAFVSGDLEARIGSYSGNSRRNFGSPSTTLVYYPINAPAYNPTFGSNHHVGFGSQGAVEAENSNLKPQNQHTTHRTRRPTQTAQGYNNYNQHNNNNNNQYRHPYDEGQLWGSTNNIFNRNQPDSKEKD
jgi:hypothetical protein